MQAINPATGEAVKRYQQTASNEVPQIIDACHQDFLDWRHIPFAERADKMRRAARILREDKQAFAELIATEMGKPLAQGIGEIEKCALVCEYYADQAAQFLSPETIATDASESYTAFEPIGIVLAVMPWNFPFWQVFRFAAPGLMAGNGALLKHASNVPGCALAIEDIFRRAGFPENIFRTLLIGSKEVPAVIEHPLVRAVTLTGSTEAGKSVAAVAGRALKKTVLELGGSDPYVILDDADLESTVETCVTARLVNSGQSCVAAKRFIVTPGIRERFEKAFTASMESKKIGDPFDQTNAVGPLARADLRDELHRQVLASVEGGAKLLTGGTVPDCRGAYYPPTVLTDVKKGMPAYDEELFGPVAAIIPVADEAEAIRVANDTVFGLGAAVFTEDIEKGKRIAEKELDAGCCFVNAFVKSDPRLPFGGVKESGYGRELSHFGIREFVNIKTVYVK
jgi:succinate-semialdehyde dehydrogenase / glutarate-semialdehyde dehydrogenase